MPPDPPLLSVRHLRQWFALRQGVFGRAGHVKAVDDVSFDLHAGEVLAVVGESGCGKSSLAKTIVGLHRPTAGELHFDGRALHDADAATLKWYRRNLGFVQQDPYGALAPFLNLHRILEEPLIIHGVPKAERPDRIRAALDEVRLTPVDDFIGKYPHMLSGGQQQRVVIARAILLQPRLIVADEPVSMLDASVRVEILELLRQLQQVHRLAAIYITHDLSTVRHFATRILVMYGGRIIESSPSADLVPHPLHPYTQALLAAIPDPDAANAGLERDLPPGEPPSLLHPPPGCRFHPRCPRLIRGTCEVRDPPEFEPASGHRTRCWLYDSPAA